MQDKPGKLEFANQATMFLDEISAMGLPLQGRLLRVMQEGQFARPGGSRDVRVDVRLVAATNRDLEQAVAAGQFREDVHARLNLLAIAALVDLHHLGELRADGAHRIERAAGVLRDQADHRATHGVES
jgi:two-component system nitrogen regulation response regulator GlnG